MSSGFASGVSLGIFLASVFNLILILTVAKPLAKEYGFLRGACTVACGVDKAIIDAGLCYCETVDRNRFFKEIPKYRE